MHRNDRPNLFGAAIFALVLGVIMLGLSLHAKLRGAEVGTDGVLLGCALLIGSAAAYVQHKVLEAMTPEEQDRYWARKDVEWRATADAHARSVLGRDYDKQ